MQHSCHRRSIRLKHFDYSQVGAYFVTLCAFNRECLFGGLMGGKMGVNTYGQIVEQEWLRTANLRQNVQLDSFVVMPNHFHGIIVITDVGATRRVAHTEFTHQIDPPGDRPGWPAWATHRVAPTGYSNGPVTECSNGPAPGSVGAIIGQFKSIVTKRINQLRQAPCLPVWQRNYYEHVIRNESDLNEIRQYILDNPAKWELDPTIC